MRRAALLTLAAAAACADGGATLPLDVAAGDVVVAVSTVDGRAVARTVVATADAPLRIPSDPDRPVFTWVLRPGDHVDPTGAPISAAALAAVVPRLLPDTPGEGGACGRCEAPTAQAPAVVHPGDSCPVPPFLAGAVWRPEGGAYRCRGAADSRVCPAGDAADDAAVLEVQRQLRLDHPGACACTLPEAPDSLAGMTIDPVGPVENPVPIYIYARRADGVIVGVSRAGVLRHDPATGETEARRISDWPIQIRTFAALRDGSALATGDMFNTGVLDEQAYFRFREVDGVLEGPEPVPPSAPALAQQMRYLGSEGDDFALYLVGGVRDALGVEPAMFACTDNLACRQVDLTDCPRRTDFSRLRDAVGLPDGFGLAVGANALFYRRPGPEGTSPDDPWRCDQPIEDPIETLDPAGAPVEIERFETVGALDDRLFVCARARVPACTSSYAVVLTATASADADPEWRVAYQGAPRTGCGPFLPRAGRIGLDMYGARLVEFDRAGAVAFDGSVFDRYGPLDGLGALYSLGDGFVVSEATENRAFVATASAAFAPIYGPEPRTPSHHRAALALPSGGFLAFGDGPPVRVTPEEIDGRYVGARVARLADTTGVFGQAALYDAAWDDDGVPLVVGDLDGPFVARLRIEGDTVVEAARLATPPGMPRPRHVAALGGGRFVVLTQRTQAYLLTGEAFAEVPIEWDVPGTEAVEARPPSPVDGCTGEEQRLDLWRDVDAAGGVAWAVGGQGLAARITPDGPGAAHAERSQSPDSTAFTAVDARCPGRPWLGGRGLSIDLGGLEMTTLQLFGVAAVPEPRRGESVEDGLDPRRQSLDPIAAEAIFGINVYDLRTGTPKAILRDVGREAAAPAVVLESGYVYRPDQGLEFIRVPFSPDVVVQSDDGYVLFGGDNGRLAVGVPASRQ